MNKKMSILTAVLALVVGFGIGYTAEAKTITNLLGQVIEVDILSEESSDTAYQITNHVDRSEYALFPSLQGFAVRDFDTRIDGTVANTTVTWNAAFDNLPSNAIITRAIFNGILPQTPGTNSIGIGFGGGTDLWSANITNFVNNALRITEPSNLKLTNSLPVTMTVVGSITQFSGRLYIEYIWGM